MLALARALETLGKLVRLAATLVLLISVALNFANIVGRYFFNSPIEWGEEVMLFLMVGMVFLGAVVITVQGRHIRMDLAVALLPAPMQNAVSAFGILCEGIAGGLVVWLGVPVVLELMEFDQRAEASNLPLAYPQAIVPFGMGLIALICAGRLILLLGGRRDLIAGEHVVGGVDVADAGLALSAGEH